MDEAKRLAELTLYAARTLDTVERTLGSSPYMYGAPKGTRARFWMTMRSMIEDRYLSMGAIEADLKKKR